MVFFSGGVSLTLEFSPGVYVGNYMLVTICW